MLRLLKPNPRRKNFRMRRRKTWWQVLLYLLRKKQVIYQIVIIGGIMFMALTGGIQRARDLTSPGKKITRLFISQKKMRKHMQNGLAREYQRRRNGNLQLAEERRVNCIPGEIHLN